METVISERKCKISSHWASKSLHLFFSKNGHFQQLSAKFFFLFNFNVYSNSSKDSDFTIQQSVVYQNTLLHIESSTKVFLHQGRCSMDNVHYLNNNSIPGTYHSHLSRTILPWSVWQNWRASESKGWPDECSDIIVMLRMMLGSKIIRRKEKGKKLNLA